ncbi:hypothetical protein [Haloarchaeobius iranensis]|uniref:Diaminopimelate epimerase n=1 Tax=Haloarchaeobius iranensis TaxID=996166 RepID=A0A1G9UW48_9EURY|nr:hypothetical protein [Haloarchaeobius iranensis]SDM64076.1 hypothetical protein SAMN05192554_10536 [Haloarchaeobius iranensis]
MSDRPARTYRTAGRAYLVVDTQACIADRRAFARSRCRADGAPALDGVLFCALEERYDPPRVVLTAYGPDGTTEAVPANGALCAARWAMDRAGTDAVMLDTLAGTRRAESHGREVSVEVGDRVALPTHATGLAVSLPESRPPVVRGPVSDGRDDSPWTADSSCDDGGGGEPDDWTTDGAAQTTDR